MSDIIISAEDLCKVYRLYSKPHYRMLDVFGLLRNRPGLYTEHVAVDHLNLEIRRGEKVAFIGRNGAGKSTLLKLIARAIEPTSGRLEVNSRVHALLQIGTGFHPEFTGRENVYSFLAQLGVIGREADKKVEEIIEFSELEEYADQPIKTYSTGMGVRIMFATSTAIKPDILVLDEVLGVGDAYFANKSYERMKLLSESEGATLLLVTHDVYSAANFCDRMIWIDRGQVVYDDDCSEVIKAYEASIRLQEEERLRQRTLSGSAEVKQSARNKDLVKIFFQVVPENRLSMKEKLTFASLRLRLGNDSVIEIPMKDGKSAEGIEYGQILASVDEGNWGNAYQIDGRWSRDFLPHGSIFHRAPFLFAFPVNTKGSDDLIVEFDINDICASKYFLEGYFQDGRTICHPLETTGNGSIKTISIPLETSAAAVGKNRKIFNLLSQNNLTLSGQSFGTKQIVIDVVCIKDGQGNEKLVFEPLADIVIVVSLRVLNEAYCGKPTFMVTFHREGFGPATRMICDDIEISGEKEEYELKVHIRPLLVGPGVYSVTVALFEPGYFEKCKGQHCASNPMVIDMKKSAIFFEVISESQIFYRINYVQPCEWDLDEKK